MPTRLIKIDSPGASEVRLQVMIEKDVKPYAALSYCWGTANQAMTTTVVTLQERLRKIPLTTLPKTIQDAVTTTQWLGLEYLWVDALCIVQDDESDKQAELSKMSEIYKGASVTISAAMTTHSDQGFLQDRDLSKAYTAIYELPYRYTCGEVEEVGSVMASEGSIKNERDEPIDSRAWTLQERIMSLRILRFGSKQVEWICEQKHYVDGGHEVETESSTLDPQFFCGSPYESNFRPLEAGELYDYNLEGTLDNWRELVQQYSSRDLSELSDRLPAFSALAETFAVVLRLEPSDYWAGLWKVELPFQLLWHRPAEQIADTLPNISKRPSPSWSWASLRGEVQFPHPRKCWSHNSLEIESCVVELMAPEVVYGEVKRGLLVVRGYLLEALWTGHPFMNVTSGDSNAFLRIQPFWDLDNEIQIPHPVWCLVVCSIEANALGSCGLILISVKDNTFKRVGYFECEILQGGSEHDKQSHQNWFNGYERRTVSII